jgi:glycerol kinase
MKALLAIDQGTTGSTALVLGEDGEVLGRAYREIPLSYPHPGWVHQNPDDLWGRSLEAMLEALEAAGLRAGELAGIGITNQRETTLLWDRRTGEALAEAIVWQSRQTQPLCDRLSAHGTLVEDLTGLRIDPYFSATKIRFLLERDPLVLSRARAGEVCFGTVDTWLLFRMTGGAVHATDPTNASRTLLYNTRDLSWDESLLEAFGVPDPLLPRVLPSAGVFGLTAPGTGLPAGIPIAGVAGDQQSALFGQGCWEPGSAKNTYGTGCFLVKNTGAERSPGRGGILSTLACDRSGKPCHALEGSVFVAGAAIQWLRDGLGLLQSAHESEALARSVPDSGGVYLVPAFTGLGTPYWDSAARGAYLGLTRGAGRAHLVRAALEAIAYQTRDVVDAMNALPGARLHALRVDGGAAGNEFLMQFQADILGIPLERPAQLESTALGAAWLAGLGVGLFKTLPQTAAGVDRRFEPRMGEDQREALYRGWKDAVGRVLSKR